MIAVLKIEMEWTKESRTPNGAMQRKNYYCPVKIEEDVELSGCWVFLKCLNYCQTRDKVVYCNKSFDEEICKQKKGKAFTGIDEYKERLALLGNRTIAKDRGAFYNMDKLRIPCVSILEEGEVYRIKWFDSQEGMPRRRGGNEDLYKKGSICAGQPNRLNETAFILRQGQAGILKYNYRYTGYDGQYYRCYYVYIVNAKNLTRNIFIRDYDFEYSQLADLF